MYPILVGTFRNHALKATEGFKDFEYPVDVERLDFIRLPLLSYCRTQAMAAIRECGGLADVKREDLSRIRWRASVPAGYRGNYHESRLELYMDNEDGTKRLVYTSPICGAEFEKLPLVLRLGIELLFRKECGGTDPE